MLQFWKISTKAAPLCSAAFRSTSVEPFLSVSMQRATKVASAPSAIEIGLKGWSSEPIGVDFAGHDPDGQVRPRRGEPGRDRRGAPVDRVHAVRLHVVGEARRAADPRHEDDSLALE